MYYLHSLIHTTYTYAARLTFILQYRLSVCWFISFGSERLLPHSMLHCRHSCPITVEHSTPLQICWWTVALFYSSTPPPRTWTMQHCHCTLRSPLFTCSLFSIIPPTTFHPCEGGNSPIPMQCFSGGPCMQCLQPSLGPVVPVSACCAPPLSRRYPGPRLAPPRLPLLRVSPDLPVLDMNFNLPHAFNRTWRRHGGAYQFHPDIQCHTPFCSPFIPLGTTTV